MALFDNPEHEFFFLAQIERLVDIQEARLLCDHPELAPQILEEIQAAKDAMEGDLPTEGEATADE